METKKVTATAGQVVSAAHENSIPRSAEEIKSVTSFRRLLELDGCKLIRNGKGHKCLCPFHAERTASFSIREDDAHGKCFGCGWSGDVIDYVMKRDGVDFQAALLALQNNSGIRTDKPRLIVPRERAAEPIPLTGEQRKTISEARSRLSGDRWLCERIAQPRKWKPETIQLLAEQGYLGWYRACLAFLYPGGMKLRDWPNKHFTWEFGQQHLWRGNRLNGARSVYLTEGETDAISLIDIGLERDGTVVVCVPGARAFDAEWAALFEGKSVTLCFDNDEVGERATAKVANLLQFFASPLQTLDLGEVAA